MFRGYICIFADISSHFADKIRISRILSKNRGYIVTFKPSASPVYSKSQKKPATSVADLKIIKIELFQSLNPK